MADKVSEWKTGKDLNILRTFALLCICTKCSCAFHSTTREGLMTWVACYSQRVFHVDKYVMGHTLYGTGFPAQKPEGPFHYSDFVINYLR